MIKGGLHILKELEKLLDPQMGIAEHIYDGFVSVDTDWNYAYINHSAARIFRMDSCVMLGKDIRTPDPEGTGIPFHPAYEEAIREQKQLTIQIYLSWNHTWVENRIYPSEDGLFLLFTDITERRAEALKARQNELEVEYLLQYDYLTSVFNRIHFEKAMDLLDMQNCLPISVIVGDINGLKLINDAFGHKKGDALIRETAFRIKNCCREEDIPGRIGGDEFGVLLPCTDNAAAERILNQIKTSFEEYNHTVANDAIRISISFGYATKDLSDVSMSSVVVLAEEYMYKRKLLEKKSLHSSILYSIKSTMFAKSRETQEHAERLAELTKRIGQKLNLPIIELNELELLAMLHDIGKVGINDQILNKPDKLTEDEWEQMKMHSEIGCRIAMASPELLPISDYILSHHERWDGHGYPQKLAGCKIPLASRILAVADAFDAMTQDRIYRKAMSIESALEEISRNRGTQFDPDITDTFLSLMREKNEYSIQGDLTRE